MTMSFSLSFYVTVCMLYRAKKGVCVFLVGKADGVHLRLVVCLSFTLISVPLVGCYYGCCNVRNVLVIPAAMFVLRTFVKEIRVLGVVGNATGKV